MQRQIVKIKVLIKELKTKMKSCRIFNASHISMYIFGRRIAHPLIKSLLNNSSSLILFLQIKIRNHSNSEKCNLLLGVRKNIFLGGSLFLHECSSEIDFSGLVLCRRSWCDKRGLLFSGNQLSEPMKARALRGKIADFLFFRNRVDGIVLWVTANIYNKIWIFFLKIEK